MITKNYLGIIFAILGAILIGSQGIIIKQALTIENNSIGLLIVRNAIFVLISFFFIKKQNKSNTKQTLHSKNDIWQAALIGLLSYLLSSLFSILALKSIDAQTERFIFMSYPIYFLLFVGFKRIGIIRAILVIVLFITGMNYLLGVSQIQDLNIIGVSFSIISSVLFAIYLFFLEKKKDKISVMHVLFYGSLASLIGATAYGLFDYTNLLVSFSNYKWLYYAFIYAFICYFAMWFIAQASYKSGAYKVSFISALSPIFTSIFALLVLNSSFSEMNFFGGCLLVISVLIANSKTKVKS